MNLSLRNGINLIAHQESDSVLHILTSRESLETGATALWIDSGNRGGSYKMAAAGGREILDKIEIARAFTTYQHYTLIQSVENELKDSTNILVVPSIDQLYIEGQLGEEESKELLKQSMDHLNRVSQELELKVIVTVKRSNEMKEIVQSYVDKEIDGSKIETESFDRGSYVDPYSFQTTIPDYLQRTDRERDNEWEELTKPTETI